MKYQEFCKKSKKPGCDLTVYLLGLAGETGEVLDIFKKARRDQQSVDLQHVKEEIGDVCWYIANLCTELGWTIEEVLECNIKKLEERYHIK